MALEVKVFDKVLKKDYEDAILLSSSEIISVLQNDVLEVAGLPFIYKGNELNFQHCTKSNK